MAAQSQEAQMQMVAELEMDMVSKKKLFLLHRVTLDVGYVQANDE